MGSGASVSGLTSPRRNVGYFAGIDVSQISPSSPIAQCLLKIEALMEVLSMRDQTVLLKERENMFRQHAELIIPTITKRSKKQLNKMVVSASSSGTSSNGLFVNPGDTFKISGVYGKFLTYLAKPSSEIDLAYLMYATSGLGSDETIIGSILATATLDEIVALNDQANRVLGCSLLDKLKKSTRSGSATQMLVFGLVERAMKSFQAFDVDEELARIQAHELYITLSGRHFYADEQKTVLDVFIRMPREQLVMLKEIFPTVNKGAGLDKILRKQLSSTCANIIDLLMMPRDQAIAKVILDTAERDSNQLVYLVTKYDKIFLDELSSASDALLTSIHPGTASVPLSERLQRYLSGNYRRAVQSWLTPADSIPDKGNLEVLERYVLGKYPEYNMRASILGTLVDESSDDFKTVMEQLDLAKSSLSSWLDVADGDETASVQHPTLEKHAAPNVVKAAPTKRTEVAADVEDYETKLKAVSGYLLLQFELHDSDDSGQLETEEFWKFFKQLHLENIGFSAEEIEAMREWCDFDMDGVISYEECVQELAEAIIGAMEARAEKGTVTEQVKVLEDAVAKYNQDMHEAKTLQEAKRLEARGNAKVKASGSVDEAKIEALPPTLATYLKDTFQAFDINHDRSLDRSEFFNMLTALHLGLSEENLESIQAQFDEWDLSQDGKVVLDEALYKFTEIIQNMRGEGRQDHWIGLVDASCDNAMFWYNISTQASQWMSADDSEQFKASATPGDYQPSGTISSRKRRSTLV